MSNVDRNSGWQGHRIADGNAVAQWRARRPAVPVAICFSIGIALDRWLELPWMVWLIGGLLLAVGWMACQWRQRHRLAAIVILLWCLFLGGGRHHMAWYTGRVDDIVLFATNPSQPVRLMGTLVSEPRIRSVEDDQLRSVLPPSDRSTCLIACRSLVSGRSHQPVSGLSQLSVSGHLLHAHVGDEVEVFGQLFEFVAPRNPGEFDFREYHRRKGVRTRVFAGSPEAVQMRAAPTTNWLSRSIARVRDQCQELFVVHLSQRTLPTASALLLGDRSDLSDDVRQAFAESGTMHMLAVSGLHVGILAALVWFCCRLLNLSPAASAAVLLTIVFAFALITNGRPPVIRATVFAFIATVGYAGGRRSQAANVLALSALVVLIWCPTDLFATGTQLSFLAVTALIWMSALQTQRAEADSRAASPPIPEATGWVPQTLGTGRRWLKQGYVLTAAISLFTAPLIAARFHLVSPIGLAINILLVPVVVLVLWLGFGFLFCGFLLPRLAFLFAVPFEKGLGWLLAIVDEAAHLQLSHFYVAGPATWWLVGYYVLLAAIVWLTTRRRPAHVCWKALFVWCCVGLAVPLMPTRATGLRCTFLDVGHGCSVLLELPSGKTLVYDAGSLHDGMRASNIVRLALWERNRSRIEAIMLSHADIDHYNGVPEILRTIPVGTMFVARPFLDFDQKGVAVVCEAAADANVPIRIVGRGDQLLTDPEVVIRVLQPGLIGSHSGDNENSIVIEIEYAGRRILLCGDLEKEGLQQMLSLQHRKVDLLLSPHHGSLASNTRELAEWSQPDRVVVSGSRHSSRRALKERYGDETRILSTHMSGAITIEIDATGTVRESHYIEHSSTAKPITM